MEEQMKYINLSLVVAALAVTSCSMFKSNQPQGNQYASSAAQNPQAVQTEAQNKEAFARATNLTQGWPDASTQAAKDLIAKYGDPHEVTSDSLIWRNVAPFKKIIVHKEVYSSHFPILHQNAVEHVVDYRAPVNKIDDVWRFDGSIVLNRTTGEMSAYGQSEPMNITALNLADKILRSQMSAEAARVTYGKELLAYMDGTKTATTQVLGFGSQYQTPDADKSVRDRIRWIGDPAARSAQPARQAQEAKKK